MDSTFIKGYILFSSIESVMQKTEYLIGVNTGTGTGMHFITVENNPDIPIGFHYASGFIVHRGDTASIVLFSYNTSEISIISCIRAAKDNIFTWTKWKVFTGIDIS